MQAEEVHSDSARSTDSLTKRKSLGLKGAKKALKKLFGMQPSPDSPVGDSRPTAGSSAEQLNDVEQAASHTEQKREGASDAIKEPPKSASHPSNSTQVNSNTNNKTQDSQPEQEAATQDDADMNALQPRQQQPRPRVKLPTVKPINLDKENVSPETEAGVAIEPTKSQQNPDRINNGMTPEEQLAEMMKNPVIAAQRAEHMRFMGEALDMVRHPGTFVKKTE